MIGTVCTKSPCACAGHAIGVIVADTEAAAQAASRAVAVTYQDILPILSIEQAIEANSYFEVLHAFNMILTLGSLFIIVAIIQQVAHPHALA